MKVLVATGLYPPEIGGPATYAKLMEERLPERGIEVTVVPFRTVRKYWKVFRHIAYFWALLGKARQSSVVYALDPVSVGLPAFCVSLILRKPLILKMVGDYAWEQSQQRFAFSGTLEDFQTARVGSIPSLLRFIERMVARASVRVIVPSQYLARVVAQWGVPQDKIVVIYNGVSVGDVGNKETIRGVLHFTGSLIISVGRLVPWKGFDVLIKVFAQMRKKRKDMTLFIVGSGPDLERLEKVAEDARVADAVIFAGAVDHEALLRYINASDVFVLNTSYEGFSHLILETLAVGVPIVTTAVGGNPEVLKDGENGYLVRPNDMSALSSRILTLLEKPEVHTRMATLGRQTAARFSEDRVVTETVTLLQSL